MRPIDADKLDAVKYHPYPYPYVVPADVDEESYKRGWNEAIDAIIMCAPTLIESEGSEEYGQKQVDSMQREVARNRSRGSCTNDMGRYVSVVEVRG